MAAAASWISDRPRACSGERGCPPPHLRLARHGDATLSPAAQPAPPLDRLADLGPLPNEITTHLDAGYDSDKTRALLSERSLQASSDSATPPGRCSAPQYVRRLSRHRDAVDRRGLGDRARDRPGVDRGEVGHLGAHAVVERVDAGAGQGLGWRSAIAPTEPRASSRGAAESAADAVAAPAPSAAAAVARTARARRAVGVLGALCRAIALPPVRFTR
ncbi:hypothetical protein SHKM778_12060 [Streptomyces sp. KM77-8]|uniref:Transposase IS4-like domain-containing protein n=1 Tax=Streptomyces haneummycinicus TaxID=3074435 RepID=A0AAT9HBY2_9ACTN